MCFCTIYPPCLSLFWLYNVNINFSDLFPTRTLILYWWPIFNIIMIFFNFNLICTLDCIFVTNFDLTLIHLTLNFWTWWPTFFLWPLWPSLFIFCGLWLFLFLFLGICVGLCFLGRRFFNLKINIYMYKGLNKALKKKWHCLFNFMIKSFVYILDTCQQHVTVKRFIQIKITRLS